MIPCHSILLKFLLSSAGCLWDGFSSTVATRRKHSSCQTHRRALLRLTIILHVSRECDAAERLTGTPGLSHPAQAAKAYACEMLDYAVAAARRRRSGAGAAGAEEGPSPRAMTGSLRMLMEAMANCPVVRALP